MSKKSNPTSFFLKKNGTEYKWYWVLAGILVATFLVYYKSIFNGLIDWDDYEYIVRNKLLYNFSWDKIKLLYQQEKHITLSIASVAIQMKFTGLDPRYLHFVNILLHLINCFLVFYLVKKLTKNAFVTVLAVAFFALHPTRVESIAWVMQRKDLLYTMFYLFSLIFYAYYLEKKEKKFVIIIMVIVFAWLSSISKVQAFTLPFVLILIDLYYHRRISFLLILEKIIILDVFLLHFSFTRYFLCLFLLLIFTDNFLTVKLKKIIVNYDIKRKIIYFLKKFFVFKKEDSVLKKSRVLLFHSISLILVFFIFKKDILSYVINVKSVLTIYWDEQSSRLDIISIFSFSDRIFMFCYSLVFYIYQFLYPFNLCAMHPYPVKVNGFLPIEYYASGILVLIIFALIILLIIKSKKNRKILIFGILFFLINIFMVGHILPIKGRLITADRYAYLAYLGLFFIMAYYINIMVSTGNKTVNKIIYAVLIFLFGGYSYYSYSRIAVWKNSYTFWSDVVKQQPDNYYAYFGLGNYYRSNNINDGALENYEKAVLLNNKDPMLFNNLGLTLYNQKKYEDAIVNFNKAITILPEFSQFYNNRGNAYYYLKKYEKALADYDTAFKKWDKNTDALINKADLETELGQADSALVHYRKCIETDPDLDIPYYKIGLYYKKLKNYKLAVVFLKKALDKNPAFEAAQKALVAIKSDSSGFGNHSDSSVENDKSVLFVNQGLDKAKANDFKSAIELFSKAIDEDPKNALAYKNRGNAKGALNDYTGSILDFDKAIELNPNDAGAYLNRGNSKFKINDESACDDWRKAQQLGNKKAGDLLTKYCK